MALGVAGNPISGLMWEIVGRFRVWLCFDIGSILCYLVCTPDVDVKRLLRINRGFGAYNERKRLREPFRLVHVNATGRGSLPVHGDELRFSLLAFRRECSEDLRKQWTSKPYLTLHVDQEVIDIAHKCSHPQSCLDITTFNYLPRPSCFVPMRLYRSPRQPVEHAACALLETRLF